MSGYLAFDADRVRRLEARLRNALDEIDHWTLRDPEAARARQLWHAAADRFDRWPVRLREISECTALLATVGLPALIVDPLLTASSAQLDLVRRDLVGLAAQGRPDLAAFAAGLERLAVAPGQVTQLLAELGASRTTELLQRWWGEQLANEHEAWVIGAPMDPLLPMLHRIGAGAAPLLAAGADGWPELLTEAPMFAAPIVFGAAAETGLLGERAGALAAPLANRLAGVRLADPRWRSAMARVVAGADDHPAAAQEFLAALDTETLALVLFWTDPALAGSILLAANDPATFRPDQVRETMLRVVGATADLERTTDGFARSHHWRPEPFEAAAADRMAFSGGLFDPDLPMVPDRFGVYLSRNLTNLVAPPEQNAAPSVWDLEGHDDDLATTLFVAMSTPENALPLRITATGSLAAAVGADLDTLHRAAYLGGAIEDAARSGELDSIIAHNDRIASTAGLLGIGLDVIGAGWATPAGYGVDALGDVLQRDVYTEMARLEVEGADVATTMALGAVATWRATHAPGTRPLGSLAPSGSSRQRQRGDAAATRGLQTVEEWADGLSPADRDEVEALYGEVYRAAFAGTGFIAG